MSEYIDMEPYDLNIYFPLSLNNEYVNKMQLGNAPQNMAWLNLQTKKVAAYYLSLQCWWLAKFLINRFACT